VAHVGLRDDQPGSGRCPAAGDAPPGSALRSAAEEHIISSLKRALLVSDTPVLAPTDPPVLQASFRDRMIPAVTYAEMNRWAVTARPKNEEARHRSVLAIGDTADVPVLPARPPVPTADDGLSDADRRFQQTHGWLTDTYPSVMRKSA
jgi:hypothetical protein